MAAHFDDKSDDLWQLAELYMDLFPPRHRANRLTDLDEVEFCARFRNSCVCKRYGIHDNTLHRHEYSCLC